MTEVRRGDTMTGADTLYEPLDYAATLAKLTDLVGREVLVEQIGRAHV